MKFSLSSYDAGLLEDDMDHEEKLNKIAVAAKKANMGFFGIENSLDRNEMINRDINAHYIGRLVYGSDPKKVEWFITQETRLFKGNIKDSLLIFLKYLYVCLYYL